MIEVRPVEAEHLPEVGRFLHEHLARRISPEAWVGSLTHAWSESQPNYGMQLRDGERLVGVFCAIYSDQLIDGRIERFCNPHSWCVLDAYRSSGIGLVLQLLKQRGYHFTMLTPNGQVAKVFEGLRFRMLDASLFYLPNLPAPLAAAGGRWIETEPARIAARLDGAALREYEAHRTIPWLRFAAFGRGDAASLAIYKRGRWKRMACARLLHLSDPHALARDGAVLRHHWLVREGMPVTRVEGRFLAEPPRLAYRTQRTQAKLASSRTLTDAQLRDVYSELMTLDL